jgi:hypothetical protein
MKTMKNRAAKGQSNEKGAELVKLAPVLAAVQALRNALNAADGDFTGCHERLDDIQQEVWELAAGAATVTG